MVFILAACSNANYVSINPHEDFVASINIIEPSIQFYSTNGKELATWNFEHAYSGGVLIQQDRILMYGNQLNEAHIYEISSGRKIKTIDVELGISNAFYDKESKNFFITNSKTNEISSFDIHGKFISSIKLRNYPMSMDAYNGKLYVVNFKDTLLSVIDIDNFQVEAEWTIPQESHGVKVVSNEDELWLGGHGAGAEPNRFINIYNLSTGELKKKLELPIMPVAIAEKNDQRAIVSHGNSFLYVTDDLGNIKKKLQVGANLFSVQFFGEYIVVAGYDDNMLYFIKDGQIAIKKRTLDGPFQLIVREAKSK